MTEHYCDRRKADQYLLSEIHYLFTELVVISGLEVSSSQQCLSSPDPKLVFSISLLSLTWRSVVPGHVLLPSSPSSTAVAASSPCSRWEPCSLSSVGCLLPGHSKAEPRASWWHWLQFCRALMAPHPLDASTPPTKESDMQSRQQEAGGINCSITEDPVLSTIQVPGTWASHSWGGSLGRFLRVDNCLPPKVFLVRPMGSCGRGRLPLPQRVQSGKPPAGSPACYGLDPWRGVIGRGWDLPGAWTPAPSWQVGRKVYPLFLLCREVIVVTLNYRLGALGFLCLGSEVVT